MGARDVIVVDVSTTGTDPAIHLPVEIAWWRRGDARPTVFAVPHPVLHEGNATEEALDWIDYFERQLDDSARWDVDGDKLCELNDALIGQTFVSWGAAFDVAMLTPLFSRHKRCGRPWHQATCLASVANRHFGRSVNYYAGISQVREWLNIEIPHSATGVERDITVTYRCLQELQCRLNQQHLAARHLLSIAAQIRAQANVDNPEHQGPLKNAEAIEHLVRDLRSHP